jgi:hypothetical protein
MSPGRLFVSFWHVGLDNLPEGSFTQRILLSEEGRRLIQEAQQASSLHCVSSDDLIAPFRKKERRKQDEL